VTLLAALALLLATATAAAAATVSGAQTDQYLEVTYAAAPGERNEVRVLPHEVGVRFAGSPPLVPGDHCFAVTEGDVRCGQPGPVGLVVKVRTGDGGDLVFARVAHVALERIALGSGDDQARGNGLMVGGPGKDDLRVVRGAALFHGGRGEDVLVGGRFRDGLDGGPGPDLLVGGRRFDELEGGAGRDQIAGGHGPDAVFGGGGRDMVRAADGDHDRIRCGPGVDRAYVDRTDETTGCERVFLGWPD
jgi:RTX calcium-binding nonapeptide repeat (4 copies)